ncbi:MAG: LysR family transcriptional regulator [Verrucomicrobiales bacterium]|nr:LysR family transcriptional regulator [Verrucomicrobiales bacterium]
MNGLPIDFHTLEVFSAVAEHRNFTDAGKATGLTQSAVSRRIQDLEKSLGIRLLDRTTRRVSLTTAGEHWLRETTLMLNQRDTSVREFREIYGSDLPTIRLGLGETIPYAHLPGVLFGRKSVKLEISTGRDETLLEKLSEFELDLAIVSQLDTMPQNIEILRTYDDPFILISPSNSSDISGKSFISLNRKLETGRKLSRWVEQNAPGSEIQIEVDTFDLAINLVSLGLGSALVPRRALAVYGKRKQVIRHDIDPVFSRTVIIAGRKSREQPKHFSEFVNAILFSDSGGQKSPTED